MENQSGTCEGAQAAGDGCAIKLLKKSATRQIFNWNNELASAFSWIIHKAC
jgi:hypothetical protein